MKHGICWFFHRCQTIFFDTHIHPPFFCKDIDYLRDKYDSNHNNSKFDNSTSAKLTVQHSTLKIQHCRRRPFNIASGMVSLHRLKPIQSYLLYLITFKSYYQYIILCICFIFFSISSFIVNVFCTNSSNFLKHPNIESIVFFRFLTSSSTSYGSSDFI